jgi:hypothetical protein
MKASKAIHCPQGKGPFSVPGSQGQPGEIPQQNTMGRTQGISETAMPTRMGRRLKKEKHK